MKLIRNICIWTLGLPIWIISRFLPKRHDLWVFGAWLGKTYSDNSQALFEYTLKHAPDITAIWQTNCPRVFELLKAKGLPVQMSYSWEGYKTALRAGKVIVSSGMIDVNRFAANAPVKVQLWHGAPLKKIGDLSRSPVVYFGYSLLRRIYPFIDPPYTIITATSDAVAEIMQKSFPRGKKVAVTGYPRNDQLFHKKTGVSDQKIVVYMPTFRQQDPLSEPLMFHGFCPERLQQLMQKYNGLFVFKMHPSQSAVPMDLSGYDRVVQEASKADLYGLMAKSSVLITDYSGVYIDYLLLDKPIIFHVYDFEDYVSKDRGFLYDFEAVTPGRKTRTWDEVYDEIERLLSTPAMLDDRFHQVKDFFHSFSDEFSTLRVYTLVRKL